MSLELHILGPSFGESIVIRMPDGTWGMIDSYRSQKYLDSLEYLKRLGVSDLNFLCWTHPDDDHSSGLVNTLKAFSDRISHFWMFSGQDQEGLFSLLDATARAKFKTKRTSWADLYEEIRKLKATSIYRLVQTGQVLLQGTGFSVTSLAPSDEMIDAYNLRLSKLLTSPRAGLKQHNNDISVALLIQYGVTRVVMGGDVSKEGWETALPKIPGQPEPMDFVKACHHGSENDYLTDFWVRFQGIKGKTDIVVTPYSRLKEPLPRTAGLALLEQHGEVTVTGLANPNSLPPDPRWDAVGLVSRPANQALSGASDSVGVKITLNDNGDITGREKIN